jgi:hypothetical protein
VKASTTNAAIRNTTPVVRIEEPDFHMATARRSFERGNLYAASDEVERAAGGVAFMAEHAAGQRRSASRSPRA